jgi:hypothetical protein
MPSSIAISIERRMKVWVGHAATVLATVVLADVPAQAAPVDTSGASQCPVRAYSKDPDPNGTNVS